MVTMGQWKMLSLLAVAKRIIGLMTFLVQLLEPHLVISFAIAR